MVVLTEAGAVALMVALFAGTLALLLQVTWQPEHDCGNRYCRHAVRRGDDEPTDWRRP